MDRTLVGVPPPPPPPAAEEQHLEETTSTLKFATRMMRVQNEAVVNSSLDAEVCACVGRWVGVGVVWVCLCVVPPFRVKEGSCHPLLF